MHWQDTLRLAFKPFRTRFLESLLIIVGVALGVGVITAMLTLVLYNNARAQGFQSSLYAREVQLTPTSTDESAFENGNAAVPVLKVGRAGDPSVTLQQADLGTIKRAVTGVQHAYLNDYTNIQMPVVGGKRLPEIVLRAVTSEFIKAADLELQSGTWPSKADYDGRTPVLVIVESFARTHFGSANPLGKTLKSENGVVYKVIGVFKAPPNSTDFANERNTAFYFAKGLVPWGINDFITMQVRELRFVARPEDAVMILEGMRTYAARRWNGGVSVKNSSAQIREAVATATSAAIVLALFASGGLLIAAINITNLMLARIIGRMRSIGVSGALGASRRQIFAQFLTEALLLGLVGGFLGVLCAWGLTAALDNALTSGLNQGGGLRVQLEPLNVLIGVLIGLGVSVLFGLYPALVAARVRPAEALRA
jgi:putative ABC transport system permease protein